MLSQRLLRFYADQWAKIANLVLALADRVVPFAAKQSLKYCRRYGHTFVTHIDGLEVCAVCHLDEELAVSIHCLEG